MKKGMEIVTKNGKFNIVDDYGDFLSDEWFDEIGNQYAAGCAYDAVFVVFISAVNVKKNG